MVSKSFNDSCPVNSAFTACFFFWFISSEADRRAPMAAILSNLRIAEILYVTLGKS
jgi:hypothetical protein